MESFSMEERSRRNWLELPRDVTLSILSRVADVDILMNVQFVCSSWFNICRDPLLWRTIDFRGVSSPEFCLHFERICRRAVDYSSGQLVEINIDDFATDHLLQYITNGSSQIKCLRLFRCFQISDGGLIAAAAKLPLLEELGLSKGSLTKDSLEAVARQCLHLKTLKFNFQGQGYRNFPGHMTLDEEVAFNKHAIAIAKNLPGLRNLELVGNELTNVGLQAVLDGCPQLESLDLRCCLNIKMHSNLQKRCKEQIKHLLLPKDGTARLLEEAHQALVDAHDYSQQTRIAARNYLFDESSEGSGNTYAEGHNEDEYSEEDDDESTEEDEEDKYSEDDNDEDAEDDEKDECSEDESNENVEDDTEDEYTDAEVDEGSECGRNDYAKDDDEDEYLEDDVNEYSEDDGDGFEGNDNEHFDGDLNEDAKGDVDEYFEGDYSQHSGPEDVNDEDASNNNESEYSQFDDYDCFDGFEDDFAELSCGDDTCDYDDFSTDDDY